MARKEWSQYECSRKMDKMEKQTVVVAEKRGSRYSGQEGGESDVGEAGDTVILTGREVVYFSVLEPQSAKAHRDHQATPLPGCAPGEEGE